MFLGGRSTRCRREPVPHACERGQCRIHPIPSSEFRAQKTRIYRMFALGLTARDDINARVQRFVRFGGPRMRNSVPVAR